LAALRGDKTSAELAREFNLDPRQIDEWKIELEQNAQAAFSASGIRPGKAPTLPGSVPSSELPTLPPQPSVRGGATLPQAPPHATPATVRTVAWEAAAAGAESANELLDDDFLGTQVTQVTQATGGIKRAEHVAAAPTPPQAERRPPGRVRKLLAPLFLGRREKQHAAKTSRELLDLYRTVAAANPRLGKQELYRRIVMARLGGTVAAADAVLARAEQSFATWPVERALTFRDVVHYLAVSDYVATNEDAADWTRENLGRVVEKLVPESL
jgi:transposase-like protein